MKKIKKTKKASAGDYVISDKGIQENREKMNLSNEQQKVVGKNINLSLPTKNKDNTIPFNAQLNASRKNIKAEPSITESHMDKKEVDFGDKTEGVMPINVKTEEYNQKHLEAFKKAEGEKDTAFWDKYVGVQLERDGQPTKVKDNIPTSSSQLQNHPDRFKGSNIDDKVKNEGLNLKVDKMVMASIKDADAMLFHIYSLSAKKSRDLSKEEKQQVIDINAGKARLIAQMVSPIRRSLDHSGDPIIKEEIGKAGVYEQDGTKIDEFKSTAEARSSYPDGDIEEKTAEKKVCDKCGEPWTPRHFYYCKGK